MRKLFVALVASILMTGFSANANTINLSTADNVAVSTILQKMMKPQVNLFLLLKN